MGGSNGKLNPNDIAELKKQTQFSNSEIKDWYKGFKKDYPHGYLTIEEFKQIYGNFYPGGNASKFAENTFRVFDHNKDGKIDFREFMIGLSMSSKGSFDDKMKWIFQLYDTNNNGLISKDEMLVIVQSLREMSTTAESEGGDCFAAAVQHHVDKLYEAADTNSDGQLSFDEFMNLAKTDPTISNVLNGDMSQY